MINWKAYAKILRARLHSEALLIDRLEDRLEKMRDVAMKAIIRNVTLENADLLKRLAEDD